MSRKERPQVVLVNRCFVKHPKKGLLIIKRSLECGHNPGLWEVPGGKLDKGQALVDAQEREVMEETGFLVKPVHQLVFADSYIIGEGQYKGLPYIGLFSITEIIGGTLKLSEEHTEHAWVRYLEMLAYELVPQVRKASIVLKEHLG
jgi:8-oxo-dGTP pyrophosphatase MutT (NUDIX family)